MLSEYAKNELARIEDDGYGGMVKNSVQELVDKFAEQGHSGFSAQMVTQAVERLFRFQPLTPLTGEDDEWIEVGTGMFQNKRCPTVFRENGRAHDIDLPRSDGNHEWVEVSFPYLPGVK